MKAVIVAAGKGTRLQEVTGGKPKCLVEIEGRPLIHRVLDALEARGIKQVYVVVGHREDEIRAAVGDRATFLLNPFYATTNNMASLWFAIPHMGDEPFLYFHADVAFQDGLLDPLLEAPEEGVALLVDPESIDEEAMKVRLDGDRFVESSKQIPLDQAAGEWTGIARFSPQAAKHFYAHAGRLLLDGQFQVYDTEAFNRMAAEGVAFPICTTQGKPWLEIDTPDDLEDAHRKFASAAAAKEGGA